MKTISYGRTLKGAKSKKNQDAFFVDDDSSLYVVVDAFGAGFAGTFLLPHMSAFFKDLLQTTSTLPAAQETSEAFFREMDSFAKSIAMSIAQQSDEYLRYRLGASLSILCVANGLARIGHIGGTVVLLLRDGEHPFRVTGDHTWGAEQVALGAISREEASSHPLRNLLVRTLKQASTHNVQHLDHCEIPVIGGDRFLLCTEGVTTSLSVEEIRSICTTDDGGVATDELIREVGLRCPAEDATLVLVDVIGL